jgi:colicin import membrane protein
MGPQAQQNGFLLSATLHGSVVALALLWSFAASLSDKPPSRILELVQGEGNNFGATVAPALGTPGGVKLTVPAPAAPKPEAAKPEPAPVTPVEPQPPQPKAPPVTKSQPSPVSPAPPTKAADTVPNFAKSIRRKLIVADSRAKAAVAKERAEEAKKAAAAAKVQHIDAAGIAKGVVGGSAANKDGGAGGRALEAAEGSAMERYDSMLIEKLRRALEEEKPPGLSDALIATIVFNIGADGSLTNIRIIKRSGSAEFDAAVRAAFRKVGSVGPPPSHKSETDVELDFRAKEQDSG